MGRSGEIKILDAKKEKVLISNHVPYGAFLKIKDKAKVKKGDELCYWDPYNAVILSNVRAKQWDAVSEVYRQMNDAGVEPDASAIQGLLIASYKLGGADALQPVLEDLQDSGKDIGHQNCRLAMKVLLPDLLSIKNNLAAEDIQQQLRTFGETNTVVKDEAINLGFVDEETFDRVVRPENMIGPK